MAKPAKQKPPPYPRPVPHIEAEEIPIAARDLAFYSKQIHQRATGIGDDDSDIEAERRAAKRRRIEAHAAAYLRGEPLYIMSAQLKGPFGKGWRNPWPKKRTAQMTGTKVRPQVVEIAETAKKASKMVESTQDKRKNVLEAKQRYFNLKSVSQEEARASVVPPTSPIVLELAGTVGLKAAGDTTPFKNGHAKERRIEEWLKTSEAFVSYKEDDLQGSPTPSRVTRQMGPATKYQLVDSAGVTQQLANGSDLIREATHDEQHSERQLNEETAGVISRPSLQLAPEPNDVDQVLADNDGSSDHGRAENAIIKASRRSLHVVPPKADLSPFEYRRISKISARNTPVQPESADIVAKIAGNQSQGSANQAQGAEGEERQGQVVDVLILAASGQTSSMAKESRTIAPKASENLTQKSSQVLQHGKSDDKLEPTVKAGQITNGKDSVIDAQLSSRPGISAATSDLNSIDLLPSAQQPPALQPVISSGLQDVSLLDTPASPTAQVPSSDIDEPDQVPLDLSLFSNDRVSQSVMVEPESTPVHVHSTQEILADIAPFTFSTVKKKQNQTLRRQTPRTAINSKKSTEKKQASFAHEHLSSMSSHGSIQDAMKAKIGKRLTSPPPKLVSKKSADTALSDEDLNVPVQRVPSSFPGAQTNESNQLKSILKSSNSVVTISSLWPSKSGVSAAQHQDSQNAIPVGSGQNALLHDDAFDLDGVISELGSFLGTWDVDKEASNLVAS